MPITYEYMTQTTEELSPHPLDLTSFLGGFIAGVFTVLIVLPMVGLEIRPRRIKPVRPTVK